MKPLALAAALAVFASSAHAAGAEERGEELGPLRVALRSGVALPFGNAFMDSGALGASIAGMVPLRLDVGWRFARQWTLGTQGQLGVLLPNGCADRCSGTDVRVGLTIVFDAAPEAAIGSWFGLGAGYEWLSWTRDLGARSVDLRGRGPEAFEIQGGLDFRPAPDFRFGPMFAASLGRFDVIELDGRTTSDFAAVVHSWVVVAVRGVYDIGL